MQHSYCTDIPWGEAQPDDLVFYPDDSHVGIAGGTDADGNLLIVHCSGGANGVVITGSAGVQGRMQARSKYGAKRPKAGKKK